MDVVLVGLINIGVFMVLFVPISQRLLGVRFGLGRLAVGAALTLTMFTPLMKALSTRSDVIPASVALELSRLQDQVSPAPWPQIEAVLTEELGASPHQVFADFTTEPLARPRAHHATARRHRVRQRRAVDRGPRPPRRPAGQSALRMPARPGRDRRRVHADPHPGNFLLLTDGRIGMLDFGSVGRT